VTLPKFVLPGEIESVAAVATVSIRDALPVPTLFVALRVTVEAPADVGVPEIRPVAVLTDKPAGKPVAPKLVGELVAVI
jgi:hypothetical protein